MKDGPDIAQLASLIGEPARANMLEALMSGRALTAGELAHEAGVTAPTASAHLSRLAEAGLLQIEVQGRHRYHRLASPAVAEALEALMGLAAGLGRLRARPGPRDPALRLARVCYDHLAGELGVRLHDRMIEQGLIVAGLDGLALSAAGHSRLTAEGLDVGSLTSRHRPLCRSCLDWSERRLHLAGSLGAALLRLIFDRGWGRRDPGSRAVLMSKAGLESFNEFLLPLEGSGEAGGALCAPIPRERPTATERSPQLRLMRADEL